MTATNEEDNLKEAIELYAQQKGLSEALEFGLITYEEVGYLMAKDNIGDMATLLIPKTKTPGWLEKYQDRFNESDNDPSDPEQAWA